MWHNRSEGHLVPQGASPMCADRGNVLGEAASKSVAPGECWLRAKSSTLLTRRSWGAAVSRVARRRSTIRCRRSGSAASFDTTRRSMSESGPSVPSATEPNSTILAGSNRSTMTATRSGTQSRNNRPAHSTRLSRTAYATGFTPKSYRADMPRAPRVRVPDGNNGRPPTIWRNFVDGSQRRRLRCPPADCVLKSATSSKRRRVTRTIK